MEEVAIEKESAMVEKKMEHKNLSAGKIFLIIFGTILILGGFTAVLIVAAIKDSKVYYTYHEVGEEFVFYELNYTANSYGVDDYYSSRNSFDDAYPNNENNLFCFIRLKVYNPTNAKIVLKDYFTSNIDYTLICDGIEYNAKYGYSDCYLMSHDDIDARETIEADLLFEAPKEVLENAQKIELRLNVNKENTKDFHIVKLKG